MSNDFPVDVSPEMQIYRILQHLNYNLETAYAEFIDNSIQSFLDNKAALSKLNSPGVCKLNIDIQIFTDSKKIIIKDDGGGIKRENMQRALKLGTEIGLTHSKDSLSVYGIGMKSAAIWFSDQWSISTSAIGIEGSLNFDFNLGELLSKKESTATVVYKDADKTEHYTIITLTDHIREESLEHYKDSIVPFITETFFKFKDSVVISFYYDGVKIQPNPKLTHIDNPKIMVYPEVDGKGVISIDKLVRWYVDVEFEYQKRKVTGFLMLRAVGSYKQPGIRLLRNNRVVEGTTVFPNIPEHVLGTKNKYAAQRIYGEFHLDDFPVDFMKTNFNENLKSFYVQLRELLSNNYVYDIINQAKNYRKKVANLENNKAKLKEIIASGECVDICDKKQIMVASDVNDLSGGKDKPPMLVTEKPNGAVSTIKDVVQEPNSQSTSNNNASGASITPPEASPQPTQTVYYQAEPENRLEFSDVLAQALSSLKGNKLPKIYQSMCAISLKSHGILIYVGAWSLMESMTAALGRQDQESFVAFCGSKVTEYTKDRSLKNDLSRIIKDISEKGNCNKHSPIYANPNAIELRGSFMLLEPFLIYMINKFHEKNNKP